MDELEIFLDQQGFRREDDDDGSNTSSSEDDPVQVYGTDDSESDLEGAETDDSEEEVEEEEGLAAIRRINGNQRDQEGVFVIILAAYWVLMMWRDLIQRRPRWNPIIPVVRLDIDAYDDITCERLFRFRADEIRDIIVALRMPDYFTLVNRGRIPSIEGVCIVLRRLAYPCRYIELVQMFGRSESMLSRITSTVLRWICDRWMDTLFHWDHARLTPAKLEEFARAVKDAGSLLPGVIGFIDGTVRPIARPIEGQELDYNGHHRVHAMKYQAVTSPDGIIIHLSGPYQGRHHDLSLLRASGITNSLYQHAKDTRGNQLYLYGDPGYQISPVLMVPYSTTNITPRQQAFNESMSRVRVAVEWTFGHVLQYFAFSDYKKSQRSLLSCVHRHYVVSVLFSNIHSCITQNNAAVGRFGVLPPSLEEYLHYQ